MLTSLLVVFIKYKLFWFRLPPATKAPRGRPSPRRGTAENGKKTGRNWWVGIRAV